MKLPRINGFALLPVLLLLGLALVSLLVGSLGMAKALDLLNVPPAPHVFSEARILTAGAESAALGHDPLEENPQHPQGALSQHTRIWQGLALLGIDQADTVWIGVLQIGLFFAGLFLFVPHMSARSASLVGLAVFSPAVLMGGYNGSTDLLMFFLLALALLIMRFQPVVGYLLCFAGFLLKIYPIFALAVAVQELRRRALQILAAAGVVGIVYLFLTWNDLVLINQTTERGDVAAYGTYVLGVFAGAHTDIFTVSRPLYIASFTVAIVLLLSAYLVSRPLEAPEEESPAHISAFQMGAALYIGTFLIGNNWNDRLIFLIFALPQLVRWAQTAEYPVRSIARTTLVAGIGSMWTLPLYGDFESTLLIGVVFLFDEALNWLLFVCLVYLFSCTLPYWVHQMRVALISAAQKAEDPEAASDPGG